MGILAVGLQKFQNTENVEMNMWLDLNYFVE